MLDWNPALYLRFANERTRPAAELLALLPDWVDLTMYLEDMTDAYRQVPGRPEDARFMLVCLWVP